MFTDLSLIQDHICATPKCGVNLQELKTDLKADKKKMLTTITRNTEKIMKKKTLPFYYYQFYLHVFISIFKLFFFFY